MQCWLVFLTRRGELRGSGVIGGQRVEVVETPEELDFVEHAVPGRGGEPFDEAPSGDVGNAALHGR